MAASSPHAALLPLRWNLIAWTQAFLVPQRRPSASATSPAVLYGPTKVPASETLVRDLSEAEVEADIEATLARVQLAQGLPQTQWVVLSSHWPFNLEVSEDAIRHGFYERLCALNGKRNTFWNGAAFWVQDSSVLWQTREDYFLLMVLDALG
jgi:hypothetical protein